mgnify:CR=1 FL=1
MSQLQVNWSALDQGAELAAQGQAALADAAERTADIRRQLAQELLIGLEFSMLDQRKRRIERFQKSFEDLNRVLGTAADRYRHVEKSNANRLTRDGTDPNRGAAGALGGGGFRIPVPEAVGAGTIAAGVISSGGSSAAEYSLEWFWDRAQQFYDDNEEATGYAKKFIGLFTEGKLKTGLIFNTFKIATSPGERARALHEISEQYKSTAADYIADGDYKNALKYTGKAFLAAGEMELSCFGDVITETAGDFVDTVGGTVQKATALLGKIIPGDGGTFLTTVSESIDTTTNGFVSWLRGLL